MRIETINPFDNQVVKTFEEMTPDAVHNAIAQAETTFGTWRTRPFSRRSELLHQVAHLMRVRSTELATLITLEMGKLLAQSHGEIALSADIFDYYADHGEQFLADEHLNPRYGTAYIKKSPIGVLLGVEPWNFPFYQVARFAAPNIMIG